jgi:hypothetical protein
MGTAVVQEILDKIERLSDDDRLDLTRRLTERSDAEWKREADGARRIAREKGIGQGAIDRAVEEVRYPA